MKKTYRVQLDSPHWVVKSPLKVLRRRVGIYFTKYTGTLINCGPNDLRGWVLANRFICQPSVFINKWVALWINIDSLNFNIHDFWLHVLRYIERDCCVFELIFNFIRKRKKIIYFGCRNYRFQSYMKLLLVVISEKYFGG